MYGSPDVYKRQGVNQMYYSYKHLVVIVANHSPLLHSYRLITNLWLSCQTIVFNVDKHSALVHEGSGFVGFILDRYI